MRPLVRPKRRVSTRFWHVARYDGKTLEPQRGGRVVVVCLETLADLTNAKDSTIRLFAKQGDRLLACGPALDDIAMLRVVGIETLEWRDRLHVETLCGAVRVGEVQVCKAGKVAT